VGNENNGVSKILLENADFLIQIPMTENMQSLNVSVATGILLAKVFEQKRD
jgi:23S rRNA (guanosine2251-2'-O)-methyltransferase